MPTLIERSPLSLRRLFGVQIFLYLQYCSTLKLCVLLLDFWDQSVGVHCLGDTAVNHHIHFRIGQRHIVRRWKTMLRRQPRRTPDARSFVHSHKKAHAHAKRYISRE